MRAFENNQEANASLGFTYGVILEENASILTQGRQGNYAEGWQQWKWFV